MLAKVDVSEQTTLGVLNLQILYGLIEILSPADHIP